MPPKYSTQQDLKDRYGGILENPYISKAHRHLFDGFKVTRLREVLQKLDIKSILDVGSGWGEYYNLDKGRFTGVDNSFPRVKFAQKRYPDAFFIQADATKLPFKNKTFDAVLLANTTHHLDDQAVLTGIKEMKRISRRYIIVDDSIRSADQSSLSKFFYSLDRGTMFRTEKSLEKILLSAGDLKLVLKENFFTFPKLYYHAVFVLEILF